MSERAPYSRVYWAIPDDPKFASIYRDNDHLATWLRLLLMADQAYPASAHLPLRARKASITALAEAGLIDLLPDDRFRVHGLDAERERRRLMATSRGTPHPTGRGPDGDRTVTGRVSDTNPSGPRTTGLSRDIAEDETRQAETSNAGTLDYMPTSDDFDALDVYHELTGYRPWGIWSGDALRGLTNDYTDPIVQSALRAEHATNGERKDLLDRLQARLAREAERAKRAKPPKARPKYADRYDDPEYQKARLEIVNG